MNAIGGKRAHRQKKRLIQYINLVNNLELLPLCLVLNAANVI